MAGDYGHAMLRSLPLLLAVLSLQAADTPAIAAKPSILDGITESAQASEAILDGGSTIGLIPLSNANAGKILTQYLQGFFQDDTARSETKLPASALNAIAHLNDFRVAGATHIIALYHDGGGETEFVRLAAIGAMTPATMSKLEAAGLGRAGVEGSFDVLAFKDAKEIPANPPLPALPIGRLSLMAGQLAKESDCNVDIIPLSRKDAVESYNDALKEAFSDDGQSSEAIVIPARARQLAAAFPQLAQLGTSHLTVIAFQNPRGADVVLVVGKGNFSPENQAKAKTDLNALKVSETSLTLARFVDGDEPGAATPAVTPEKKGERRFKK